MVKIAIDTPEKVENLARWGVAVINRCGKISLELNKNEVGNFDFIIWEKDGEHAKSYLNIDLDRVFDLLDIIGATLKGVKD